MAADGTNTSISEHPVRPDPASDTKNNTLTSHADERRWAATPGQDWSGLDTHTHGFDHLLSLSHTHTPQILKIQLTLDGCRGGTNSYPSGCKPFSSFLFPPRAKQPQTDVGRLAGQLLGGQALSDVELEAASSVRPGLRRWMGVFLGLAGWGWYLSPSQVTGPPGASPSGAPSSPEGAHCPL